MDGVFLSVTLMNGAVKLIKMPAVLNPLEGETKTPEMPVGSSQSNVKPPGTSGKNAAERMSHEMSSMQSLAGSGEGE